MSKVYDMNSLVKRECAELLEELEADADPSYLWYTIRVNGLAMKVQSKCTTCAPQTHPDGWKGDDTIVIETLAAIQAKMEKHYSIGPQHAHERAAKRARQIELYAKSVNEAMKTVAYA